MNNNKCLKFFSLRDKWLFRIGFYGFIIVGTYGISTLESIYMGMAYLAYSAIGLFLGVLYFLCSHCPHVYIFDSCLFYPPIILKKLYKFRKIPMNLMDKIGFVGFMGSVVIIPNIWIWKNFFIIAFFWAFALPTILGLLLYVCQRCRNQLHPDHQRQGYGKVIMAELEKMAIAESVSEITLSISLPSRKFYEYCGYNVLDEYALDVGSGEYLRYWLGKKVLQP